MTDLNIFTFEGRLTRDAELKYLTTGTAVCNFSVAINRSIPPREDGGEWKNKATFVDCQLWAKRAESMASKLLKGARITISGHLDQDTWTDSEGAKRSRYQVQVDFIRVDGAKASASGGDFVPDSLKGEAGAPAASSEDFSDDIPF